MPEASLDFGPPRRLPPRPSLEHLKNEAKRRLRAARPGAKLAQMQHQLAREYGFANWRELKANVDRVRDAPCASQVAAVGDWIGALPGNSRIALHIQPGEGGFDVTLDMRDIGIFGLAAEDVVIDEGRLSFTLFAPMPVGSHQGVYEAAWDPDAERWRGEWTSHGMTLALDFARGVYPPAPAFEGLDGFWDGRLHTEKGLLRLIFRFKTDRNGTFAWLDSPDTNLLGRPAVAISREGREVTITMRTVTVSGVLTDDGQWIEGRFVKGETVLPLVLVRRPPGAAAPLPQRAPAMDLPPAVLAKYAGRYINDLGTILAVTLEDGRLWTQFILAASGGPVGAQAGPRLDLLASSPKRFFWRIMDATAEFEWTADGRVTGVTVRQNGRASYARRLD